MTGRSRLVAAGGMDDLIGIEPALGAQVYNRARRPAQPEVDPLLLTTTSAYFELDDPTHRYGATSRATQVDEDARL